MTSPPTHVLKGVSDLLTRAVTMTDAAIQTDDWADPLSRIRLEELETIVYQARLEVLDALKSAAHEASKLKSIKKSRAKGHRPMAWRKHGPSFSRA